MSSELVPVNQETVGILPLQYYLPAVVSTNLQMAEMAYKSGLLPTHVRSPQAALYLMQRGASLGLDPFFAIENTCLINGRIFLMIHAAQALLAAKGVKWKINKLTSELADVTLSRESWADVPSVFTAQDAQRAGLAGKDSYRNHPADVLYANAFRKGARRIAADLLMGLSIIDESELRDGGAVDIGFVPLQEAEEPRRPGRPRGSRNRVEAQTEREHAQLTEEQPEQACANSDMLTDREQTELTQTLPDDPEVPEAPAELGTFNPLDAEHRKALTEACEQLGFLAKWRNDNKMKIFRVLEGCEANVCAIKERLFSVTDWGKV